MSSSSLPPRWRRAGSVEEVANWEAARLEQTQQSQPHASPWALLLLLSAVDNIVTIFIFYFTSYLAKKKKKKTQERRGRRGPSHGALLPGVGHSRESPAWPKHPLWWQSVAKFINSWGKVFTSMLIFPAGPEGYSALYETNGCRLDARGLWAFLHWWGG